MIINTHIINYKYTHNYNYTLPCVSINCTHLWTMIGMPLLVSPWLCRGSPDTCVCLSAEYHASASLALSALSKCVLATHYNSIINILCHTRFIELVWMLLTFLELWFGKSTVSQSYPECLVPAVQLPYVGPLLLSLAESDVRVYSQV